MAIKSIFTVIDLAEKASAARDVAFTLADRFGAHLTAVAPVLDPYIPGYLSAPMPMDYAMVALEEGRRIGQERAAGYARAAAVSGISVETRIVETMAGTTADIVAQAHLSDLVVIGQEDPDVSEPMRGALVEAFLFDSGVPLLLVPAGYSATFGLGRAIVAWDGAPVSARAVHAAMPLLAETKEVEVVIVAGKKGTDAVSGGEVAAYLARHGLVVTVKVLQRDGLEPAFTLLEHAVNMKADYMVMGAYGHSRLREFIMGGTTRDILDDATLPVLMAH